MVDSLEGKVEFAADGAPFVGVEVVVLEEEDERTALDDGGILAEKLGFSESWRLV